MDESLLDTDIFSELLRAKNSAVLGKGKDYLRQFGHYTISAITVVELVRGFQKDGRTDRIDSLVKSLTLHEVLSLDQDTAVIAGIISGRLQRSGQSIGHADPLIAAMAIHHDLTLITGNTAHFERIVLLGFPLRLDNWRA
jgi:tRNA(fMet)-specific endonuclease VapC